MKKISDLIDGLKIPKGFNLHLVDVGARWGTNPPWDQIDTKYINYTGFEPDTEECERLKTYTNFKGIQYLPVGLSDEFEKHILHVTQEPGCSSIYPPNKDFIDKFFQSERWNVVKKISIDTVPLWAVIEEKKLTPDVLKIDVQGASLKVLKGLRDYLEKVVFIEAEVEFSSIYKGESLFPEVDVFLRHRGYQLIDMNKFYAKRKILSSTHSSRGQVLFADVFYAKTPEAFYSDFKSGTELNQKLWSMIITLSLYGHFDLALEFSEHPLSPLSTIEKKNIRKQMESFTEISRWKVLLFNNEIVHKVCFALCLILSSLMIKTRLFGWGSDQNSIDSRYKFFLKNPLLLRFKK